MVLIFLGCAQTGTLSGGDRDETPPSLVIEESTPNYQTNFKPNKIKLTFDEWVNLKSGTQNILISPLLNRRPSFKLVGKQVQIDFSEEIILEENTTYQIQLVNAITDLTEKNPAEPISFIFSTGDILDSLTIEGNLMSIEAEKELENVQVMLYSEWIDTTFNAKRASYIVKADSANHFTFTNLPDKEFTLVAFDDQNKNGLYDPFSESFGFQINPVSPTDSLYTIELFKEKRDFTVENIDTSFQNYARIEFNQTISDLKVDCQCLWRQDLSNRITFYNQNQDYPWHIYLQDTISQWKDTITVYSLGSNPLLPEINAASTVFVASSTQKIGLEIGNMDGLKDTSLTIMHKDKVVSSSEAILDKGFIYWNQPTLSSLDTTITLAILPDQWDRDIISFSDTLSFRFDAKRFMSSLLKLTIKGMQSDSTYIVSLITPNSVLAKRFVISPVMEEEIITVPMIPGNYIVEVVKDDDLNGKWTSGSPENFLLNEKKWYFELPQIRLNWDLEHEVTLQ